MESVEAESASAEIRATGKARRLDHLQKRLNFPPVNLR